jgi:hypothetical protein
MRIKWITLIAISLIMIGCAPHTQIQKIHIQVDHQNTGEVDIFNSFDEVGRSYKKVAELKVTDNRPLNNKNRNRMIESLKSAARELGAEGIVIIKEGESVTTESLPASGGTTNVYHIFINGIALVYG